jgi:hypothetical protein
MYYIILYYIILYYIILYYIVTCRRVHVTIMTGSSSDDWIYWHVGYNLS